EPGQPRTRMSISERAQATIEAGIRAYRLSAGRGQAGEVFDTHDQVLHTVEACKAAREGVGPEGDWLIDFHQRFDFSDSVRTCRLIEEYAPYFVEDPVADAQAREEL